MLVSDVPSAGEKSNTFDLWWEMVKSAKPTSALYNLEKSIIVETYDKLKNKK